MQHLHLYRRILAHAAWQTSREPLSLPHAKWLLHSDSLTEKLQRICDCFQVEVIDEGWQAVEFDGTCAKQWVREVWLKCGERDWIFAQTILPEQTIANVAQTVPELGNRPIGLWLFPQRPERQSLEWRQDSETGLYARRSKLLLKGYPIEIKELFLTDFPFEK